MDARNALSFEAGQHPDAVACRDRWLRVIDAARAGSNDIAVHERRRPAGV
jgi:hypothetical protein